MNTGTRPTLLWLRLDLRLADHAALQAAIERTHHSGIYLGP